MLGGGSQLEENSRKGSHSVVCTVGFTREPNSMALNLNSIPSLQQLTYRVDGLLSIRLAHGYCTCSTDPNTLKTELILDPQPTKGRLQFMA